MLIRVGCDVNMLRRWKGVAWIILRRHRWRQWGTSRGQPAVLLLPWWWVLLRLLSTINGANRRQIERWE